MPNLSRGQLLSSLPLPSLVISYGAVKLGAGSRHTCRLSFGTIEESSQASWFAGRMLLPCWCGDGSSKRAWIKRRHGRGHPQQTRSERSRTEGCDQYLVELCCLTFRVRRLLLGAPLLSIDMSLLPEPLLFALVPLGRLSSSFCRPELRRLLACPVRLAASSPSPWHCLTSVSSTRTSCQRPFDIARIAAIQR
jgi:hypothetical protein